MEIFHLFTAVSMNITTFLDVMQYTVPVLWNRLAQLESVWWPNCKLEVLWAMVLYLLYDNYIS